MDTILMAGMERGLSMSDMRKMQIGQLVDFCIEYNKRQEKTRKHEEAMAKGKGRRKATPADYKAFFG